MGDPPARSRISRMYRAVVTPGGPRRLRVRLTLLYGALSVASGTVLLGLTYFLVRHLTDKKVLIETKSLDGTGAPGVSVLPPGGHVPDRFEDVAAALREQAFRQHQAELHHLLVQSGTALAIMAVLSLLIGWLVAGRVLRPVRTMTATLQQISARNLHQRLTVTGPRDELKDLADTVDGLLGRLETSLDAHKRFVANAAHELRTPLTVEHALLEEPLIDADATRESYESNFRRIMSINEQRAQLLESLLTLSSTERGLDRSEPVDLAALVGQTLREFDPELTRRGLRLEPSIAPAEVHGDSALLQRLVTNLVDNAISYNCPGGRLQVTTRVDDDHVVLRVANTGVVVLPEQVARLFEPFQRLRRTAGDGHHGLGLSIVRAIASAHEAGLGAQALPDGGLEIEVTFPTTAAPGIGQAPPTAPIKSARVPARL